MKKKILFVIYSLTGGGAEKALVNLLNMIDYEKYDVTLQLFENRGMNLEYLPEQVNLRPALKTKTWLMSGLGTFVKTAIKNKNFALLAKRLCASIKIKLKKNATSAYTSMLNWNVIKNDFPVENEKFDIAVAYIQDTPLYYVVDCVNADKKLGWMHIDYSKINNPLKAESEKYYKKLDSFITISEKCVDSLQAAYPNLDNISLLYNLNSPELIYSLSDRDPLEGMETNVPTVLSIGRMTEQKGYDFAIEAAAIMKKAGIQFRWYIMGAGPLENELRDMTKQLDVEDVVVFMGLRSNPYPYIKAATVIAQTSRYEGKSVVLDEAKILKKPILVTNYNSAPDQISNGKDGMIVDMTPQAIAEGLSQLLTDEEKRNSLSAGLESFSEQQTYWLNKHYELFEGKN